MKDADERETVLTLREYGYSQRQIHQMTGIPKKSLTAYYKGYKNENEYELDLVRNRINPETNKPFRSLGEYKGHRIRSMGLTTTDYNLILEDPTVLILEQLMSSPKTVSDIYAELKKSTGITFRNGRLEKFVRRAMKNPEGPLIVRKERLLELNFNNPLIQEFITDVKGMEGVAASGTESSHQ